MQNSIRDDERSCYHPNSPMPHDKGLTEYHQTPDAITGAPGVAFPPTRLGSGIDGGRVAGAFQRRGSLSGDLTGIACLRHSLYRCNLAHLRRKVNPKPGLQLPETGANHNFFPARKADGLRHSPMQPAFFLRKEGQNQKSIDRTRRQELT